MADLLAKFRLVDEMSSKLSTIAESGQNMLTQWESAGETANEAMEDISGAATTTVSAVDGVATSLGALESTADNAASSSDTLSDALRDYSDSTSEAISQTDYWTDAVGNYDKSVLEAIYSTEELVDMGMKSAEALQEQEQMFELCEKSADYLNKSIKATTSIENDLSKALENATSITEKVSKIDDVSAKTKETLAKASTEATEAMKVLTAAQEEADAAMEAYNATIASGTTNLNELEAAAERAGHAAEALAEANGRATEATNEVSGATEKASEEAENGGKNALNTIETVATALTSAGIAAKIKEIASETYELTTAFSEAESTVVKATGASGRALDSLTESMMDAYSASKTGSLDDTAAAIGEINTRMALTGDELTSVTGKFLDYAEITGTNVVSSIQNVTKIMNKWDIESSNVESVLDKLAYAGQISGASVDSLSSAVIDNSATFQALNMNLDNAIGLLADLELYGTSSTTTVTALRTAVNNFTSEGLDAGEALRNVINKIANMRDATEATALAVDTFGSKAGQELAGAIRSGAISVDSISQSLNVAQGTLTATAEAAQTLDQKWEQANNNIQTAFTNVLQPTIDSTSSLFADMANGMGDFLNDHPAVAKAITVIATGIGVTVTAITAFTVVTKVAIPLIKTFGSTMTSSLGAAAGIALAITAVVAGVTALREACKMEALESQTLTTATQNQCDEQERLSKEYEKTCETYGETSEQARALKYDLDEATAAIENQSFSVSELYSEIDSLHDSTAALLDACNGSVIEINEEKDSALTLSAKLKELATSSDKSAESQAKMEPIIERLNEMYPELGLNVDNVADKIGYLNEQIDQSANAKSMQSQYEAAQANIDKLRQQEEELADASNKAEATLSAAQKRYLSVMGNNDFGGFWQKIGAAITGTGNTVESELHAASTYADTARSDLRAVQEQIAECERIIKEYGGMVSGTSEDIVSAYDAVYIATSNVKEQTEELVTAYNDAYQSAYESVSGQYALWDEVAAVSAVNIGTINSSLESQATYWDNYNSNLEGLLKRSEDIDGLREVIATFADGSENSVNAIAGMASASDDDLEKMVENWKKVQEEQENTAKALADTKVDFETELEKITDNMAEAIEKMNMEDDAKKAAEETIQAYAAAILAGKGAAVDAAEQVSLAAGAALSKAFIYDNPEITTQTITPIWGPQPLEVAAYANGTTDSEDVFMSGENGPELIVGKQGSTVFPTEETDRIISALNYRQRPLQVFADDNIKNNQEPPKAQEKHIRLEIAGGGAIEVNGSGKVDKETILELLKEHLEPVLMNLIEGEMYEEGELSYEY